MTTITKQLINQILEHFPNCIECDATYFHAPGCRHGFGLDATELIKRLNERAAQLPPLPVEMSINCHCGMPAVGTRWVAYHGMRGIITAEPRCLNHSEESEPEQRPCGFTPGVVTRSTFDIQDIVMGVQQ